jgi:hypothetical protein
MKYRLLLFVILVFCKQALGQVPNAKALLEIAKCTNDSCFNRLITSQGFVLDKNGSETYIPYGEDSTEAENNYILTSSSGIYYCTNSKHYYSKLINSLIEEGFRLKRVVKATKCVGSDLYDYNPKDPHYNLRVGIMKNGIEDRPKYRFWLIHYSEEYYKNVISTE